MLRLIQNILKVNGEEKQIFWRLFLPNKTHLDNNLFSERTTSRLNSCLYEFCKLDSLVVNFRENRWTASVCYGAFFKNVTAWCELASTPTSDINFWTLRPVKYWKSPDALMSLNPKRKPFKNNNQKLAHFTIKHINAGLLSWWPQVELVSTGFSSYSYRIKLSDVRCGY